MGRPYESELGELDETYAWCREVYIEPLANSISRHIGHPLIAIGSGGSLTSAAFARYLHSSYSSELCAVTTPYDIISAPLNLEKLGVLVCTAGGSNPDVLASARSVLGRSPHTFSAICTKIGTPLGKLLGAAEWTACHEFPTPIKKDGFLATNSLLATCVLLTRAYEKACALPDSLPGSLAKLLHPKVTREAYLAKLDETFTPLWDRRTLVVLYGFGGAAAALDIESRFTEAALGNVQTADYRNFAHGRHHWLAKYGQDTAVVILSTPGESKFARKTSKLFPASIPKAHLEFDGTVSGAIASVVTSIYMAGLKGRANGCDPGRPSIPDFGRKLYSLRLPDSLAEQPTLDGRMRAAIELKSGKSVPTLAALGSLPKWIDRYRAFLATLQASPYTAVVLDYDGTLCSAAERLTRPRDAVADRLNALLDAGLYLGIATGRGSSVRDALLTVIPDRKHRKKVLIGYHNCSEIGFLGDNSTPPDDPPLDNQLVRCFESIQADALFAERTRITAKGSQITIECFEGNMVHDVFEQVSAIARKTGPTGLTVLCSTHSIDILVPGVSKVDLLTKLKEILPSKKQTNGILCIGDRGRWPGNDAELLANEVALSVDEVSSDPQRCWKISMPGLRNVEACLEYLRALQCRQGMARYEI